MQLKTDLISQGYESAHLDDIVQDAASALASDANNGGMDAQLSFLVEKCGWSEADIIKALEQG